MAPLDTTARARQVQLQIFRSQSPGERFQSAMEMSDFAHDLAAAGLRARQSEVTSEDFSRAFIELLYGPISQRER